MNNLEFCSCGPAEFDPGVMVAHLMQTEHSPDVVNNVLAAYVAAEGFDTTLRQCFTGVESRRRLMGHFQLPLAVSLDQKAEMLREARKLLR